MSRALVFGGGGVAGVAWELGVLMGLSTNGVDVTDADDVIGTSAGSVVGALVTGGDPISEFYDKQFDADTAEQSPDLDVETFVAQWAQAVAGATGAEDLRARIGRAAIATATAPERERLEIIRKRLPTHDWPTRSLKITAVDASTGEFVVFDRNSGVALVEAVAASCAVPFIWPPVSVNGRRYIDGGVRSVTNADLAEGADRVLIVAPMSTPPGGPMPAVEDEAAALRKGGADVHVLLGGPEFTAAGGLNPLDPATRQPAARAGRALGESAAEDVAKFWNDTR